MKLAGIWSMSLLSYHRARQHNLGLLSEVNVNRKIPTDFLLALHLLFVRVACCARITTMKNQYGRESLQPSNTFENPHTSIVVC